MGSVAISNEISEGGSQHTLHIYMVDTGMVQQKIVNTGSVLSSFLGP
jgi:hypothetical protein